MTAEQLKEGQQQLYQRLYSPEAFGARLMGNLSRFEQVRFRPEPMRAEGSPTVQGQYVYAGGSSAGGHEFLCLEAATGRPAWRTGVDLPMRGTPQLAGDLVLASLGNGTLTRSAEAPAGAALCLEAPTGRRVWRHDVPDGVLAQPVVDRGSVYFASRDRHCYSIDLREGKRRWVRELEFPVVAAPALAAPHLFVAASQGGGYRLGARTGGNQGGLCIPQHTRAKPGALSAPTLARRYGWLC